MSKLKDKFGCPLSVGDWALYVPIKLGRTDLAYGKIVKLASGGTFFTDSYVEFEDDPDFTFPYLCVKFTEEEAVMRKLESDTE